MKSKIDITLEEDAIYDKCGRDEPSAIDRARLAALGWAKGELDPITDDGIDVYGRGATEDEIKQTIEQLKTERESIPEYSFFGDPNWQMTNAQIEILEWILKD